MKTSEDERDVENVEAWADVFRNLLHLIPLDRRAEVLALVTKNDEAERAQRFRFVDLAKLKPLRNFNATMRLRSLVIQVLVRCVTNNHSKEDAAALLFVEHRYGYGSRRLGDYLPKSSRKVTAGESS